MYHAQSSKSIPSRPAITQADLLHCRIYDSTVGLIVVLHAYDPLDPNGNITIKWDVMSWTPDGYLVRLLTPHLPNIALPAADGFVRFNLSLIACPHLLMGRPINVPWEWEESFLMLQVVHCREANKCGEGISVSNFIG